MRVLRLRLAEASGFCSECAAHARVYAWTKWNDARAGGPALLDFPCVRVQLGNMDRCRIIYEKYLECAARCAASLRSAVPACATRNVDRPDGLDS